MDHGVGMVAGGHQRMELTVFLGMGLGVLDHLRDLGVRQTRGRLDDDRLLLAGRLVFGRDVEDTVGVDVELDLDLRHAARCQRDIAEVEAPERLVVDRPLALTLQDMHGHRGLVVVGGREDLLGRGRDGGVLLDQLGHDAAEGLDAERERRDVEQQHVLDLAAEHAALDGRADGDGLVGVDVAARGLAEELLDLGLHLGHPSLAADQDHLVDLARRQTRVLQRDPAGLDGAVDQLLDQRLELGARKLDVEMLRPGLIRRDVGQIDVGLLARGELDLGLLGGLLQALQGQRVVAQIYRLALFELGHQEVDDAHVEVFAAEEGVPVGRKHLELMLALDLGDLDDGDVEGAAAQIVDRDLLIAALLVHPVGERRRGRLVDDALDLETGDPARVLGRLALRIVEVGRDRDDGLGDRVAQIVLGGLLHLLKDLRGDLRRRHFLAVDLDPGVAVVGLDDLVGDHVLVFVDDTVLVATSDQSLDRKQCVGRVGDRLALGGLSDQHLAVTRVGDDRRCGAVAFGVLDDLDVVAFHHGDAGVGRPEIDTDDFTHEHILQKCVLCG